MNESLTLEVSRLPAAAGSRELSIPAYDRAVSALKECLEFDDTTYWKDFAEAHAAWARINDSAEALRLAKSLRLHVARRMGELAKLMQSTVPSEIVPGRPFGPSSFLVKRGLSKSEAASALKLARMSDDEFRALAGRASPPSPGNTIAIFRKEPSSAFAHLTRASGQFRNFCNEYPIKKYEQFIFDSEKPLTARRIEEIWDWIKPMAEWCALYLNRHDVNYVNHK